MKTKMFEECLNNPEFKQYINIMFNFNEVCFFDEPLLNKIKNFKLTDNMNMYDFFDKELNIGYCGLTALLLSLLFDDCSVAFGKNIYIEGTKNSPNGEHAWLKVNNLVYDTSLGLIFNGNGLGYDESFTLSKNDLRSIQEYNMMEELFKKNIPVIFKDNLPEEIMSKVLSFNIESRKN